MATLVTGCGLVGSYLARLLVEQGDRPVVYDVAPLPPSMLDIADSLRYVRGDILDLSDLLQAMDDGGVDRVIHTAGLLTPACQARPLAGVRTNLVGTATLLEACRLQRVGRMVFCSTSSLYDYAQCSGPYLTEESPVTAANVYATTKLASEHLGLNYAERYGLDFRVVRFAAVYGPGYGYGGGISNVLKDCVEPAAMGRPAVLRQRFSGTLELVYAPDAARGALLASQSPGTEHRLFNIGSGEAVTARQIADQVSELTGAPVELVEATGIDLNPHVQAHPPFDMSRSRTELGYEPAFDLRKGIRDYVAWVRQRG